jgi:hypothetical protein
LMLWCSVVVLTNHTTTTKQHNNIKKHGISQH